MEPLPPYRAISADAPNRDPVLQVPALPFRFPLSQEDRKDIETLLAKYDQETNCAGLAAPQIGISKRAIVFEVAPDPEIIKWRPDLEQCMPKTLWLNPSYKAIGTEMHEDYESCFSVKGVAALVKRYKKIRYQAYDLNGQLIQGEATGFLARVIQHETDHVDGILYIERATEGTIFDVAEYRRKRAEEMAKV